LERRWASWWVAVAKITGDDPTVVAMSPSSSVVLDTALKQLQAKELALDGKWMSFAVSSGFLKPDRRRRCRRRSQ